MANYVNRNRCLNIIHKYVIEYNESNIKEIEKEIEKITMFIQKFVI